MISKQEEQYLLQQTAKKKPTQHLKTYRAACHTHQIPNHNAKQSYVEQCNVPVKEESTEGKHDFAAASKLLLTEYQNTARFFGMNDFNIELQSKKHGKDSATGKLR